MITGGVDKFFFEWDEKEMKDYLQRTIRENRAGGGYILMTEGIPENISNEKFNFFLEISKDLRG